MRRECRIASAAILALACSPFAARAVEPASSVMVQATTPILGHTPGTPGTGAEDISPRPGDNTSGDQTLEEVPTPTSPAPRVGLFQEFGRSLLDRGIDIHGIAFDHFLANPSAGVVLGQRTNLAVLRPAADFDLGRLAGLPGGNIHIGLTFFGLRSDIPQIISQTGGVLTGFQTTPAVETNLLSFLPMSNACWATGFRSSSGVRTSTTTSSCRTRWTRSPTTLVRLRSTATFRPYHIRCGADAPPTS